MNDIYKMSELAEEFMYMLALNTRGRVLGVFELGHGTVNHCLLSEREVMIRALLCGAVSIVLIHNHPSGCPEPSNPDFEIFHRINEGCRFIGISLLDNIIIAGNTYFSFKEQGYLKTT